MTRIALRNQIHSRKMIWYAAVLHQWDMRQRVSCVSCDVSIQVCVHPIGHAAPLGSAGACSATPSPCPALDASNRFFMSQ
jgi:hypothetical protein